jgi:hypothetical protein
MIPSGAAARRMGCYMALYLQVSHQYMREPLVITAPGRAHPFCHLVLPKADFWSYQPIIG